ncbi:hypothetical protein SODALDRAFT_356455 [Sodiomyces alkalinus F11]|uniref:Uncharacterized protein n=1 Tax=Sodiomyces alkalinus (strain CBS 110278 / VKM F-3762 / F11) TaxID=1314773 RepID=A0A3N2Q152_SODAK|nr:hypothetical protein SODALDRAFT_356455 [Sodiomyces alkalinus F11]ROT40470.1 hypothetical protein SODALDRAFT_356455 [Sodiomyces alkalinus F11]
MTIATLAPQTAGVVSESRAFNGDAIESIRDGHRRACGDPSADDKQQHRPRPGDYMLCRLHGHMKTLNSEWITGYNSIIVNSRTMIISISQRAHSLGSTKYFIFIEPPGIKRGLSMDTDQAIWTIDMRQIPMSVSAMTSKTTPYDSRLAVLSTVPTQGTFTFHPLEPPLLVVPTPPPSDTPLPFCFVSSPCLLSPTPSQVKVHARANQVHEQIFTRTQQEPHRHFRSDRARISQLLADFSDHFLVNRPPGGVRRDHTVENNRVSLTGLIDCDSTTRPAKHPAERDDGGEQGRIATATGPFFFPTIVTPRGHGANSRKLRYPRTATLIGIKSTRKPEWLLSDGHHRHH